MRSIKFRAFNLKTEKMVDLETITPLVLDPSLRARGIFIPFDEWLIIEQFTGIQDRNGVDIFEGDILNEKHDKAASGGGWVAGTNDFHPENALVVEWSAMGACFKVDRGAKSLAKELAWRKQWGGLEVIGNIHENPDLLTGGN